MHQTLLNAEFASIYYLNANNKNMHVFWVIKARTKVLHKCFCCTYAYRQLHFWVKYVQIKKALPKAGRAEGLAVLSVWLKEQPAV
jgi:hypothetical protein